MSVLVPLALLYIVSCKLHGVYVIKYAILKSRNYYFVLNVSVDSLHIFLLRKIRRNTKNASYFDLLT